MVETILYSYKSRNLFKAFLFTVTFHDARSPNGTKILAPTAWSQSESETQGSLYILMNKHL